MWWSRRPRPPQPTPTRCATSTTPTASSAWTGRSSTGRRRPARSRVPAVLAGQAGMGRAQWDGTDAARLEVVEESRSRVLDGWTAGRSWSPAVAGASGWKSPVLRASRGAAVAANNLDPELGGAAPPASARPGSRSLGRCRRLARGRPACRHGRRGVRRRRTAWSTWLGTSGWPRRSNRIRRCSVACSTSPSVCSDPASTPSGTRWWRGPGSSSTSSCRMRRRPGSVLRHQQGRGDLDQRDVGALDLAGTGVRVNALSPSPVVPACTSPDSTTRASTASNASRPSPRQPWHRRQRGADRLPARTGPPPNGQVADRAATHSPC